MSSVALGKFSKRQTSNVLLGIASSLLVPSASVALCEDKDKGFLDGIVKKDKDGNIDFAGSIGQVGGADFWDEIAKASGEKVGFMEPSILPHVIFCPSFPSLFSD